MKVVFSLAKRIVEQGKLIANSTEEIVSEDVRRFEFDEGLQNIFVYFNNQTTDRIRLFEGDENHSEQWFLLDIKCFQIPLKIKL